MCLEIRDGAEESECRICSEKAAQVLGASFRRDRHTVQGLPWIFGVFQKAGARFQKKIIKKKTALALAAERPIETHDRARHRILWAILAAWSSGTARFIRPRCRCIGIGIGTRHDMFLQSSCVLHRKRKDGRKGAKQVELS